MKSQNSSRTRAVLVWAAVTVALLANAGSLAAAAGGGGDRGGDREGGEGTKGGAAGGGGGDGGVSIKAIKASALAAAAAAPVPATNASRSAAAPALSAPPAAGTTPCEYTPGVDYVGLTAHRLGPSNLTACCKACAGDPKCSAAVLSSPSDSPPQECWLKFGALAEVKKPGVWACRPSAAPALQLVPLESVPDHPSQFRNSRAARRWAQHHRYYGRAARLPLTPSQRALQKKASGTLLLLLTFMVGGQCLIFYWKKHHYRSFMNVTLAGLWLFPLAWSVYYHWWRFVTVSGVFSVATGYYVYVASRVPLDVRAPRKVYWWFNRVYAFCLGTGFFGYVLLIIEMTGARTAAKVHRFFAEVATLSLFYGLYFGVLGRDLAEMCSWRMTQTMGYVKKDDDEPQRLLPANTCALCGQDLNPELEHLIEGQDFALTESYRLAGHGGFGRRRDRVGRLMDAGGGRGRGFGGARGGFGGDYDDGMGMRQEGGGGMAEALRPERVVKLKCGHEFHEFCIRGWTIVGKQTVCPNCGDKVDINSVLGSSPWEKNPNKIWGQLLDALRYMIVWNPVIMLAVRFSVYEVESHGGF